MHRRHNSDVGDGNVVASQPLCLGELGIKDVSELVPSWRLGINDRLVGLGLKQRFHNIFDKVDVAALEPDRRLSQ